MKSLISILLLSSICHAKTIRVAVLDTGFDKSTSSAPLCPDAKPFPDSSPIKHGTNVIDLIRQNAGNSNYCVLPIRVFNPDFDEKTYLNTLKSLSGLHIDILNLSMAGYTPIKNEEKYLKILLDQGVVIFAAAGNNKNHLGKTCHVYPACADKRITIIGDYDSDSGYGPRIVIKTHRSVGCIGKACLRGTSQATAIETGRYVNRLSRSAK